MDWQRIKEEGQAFPPNKYFTSATMGAYLFWSKLAYAGAFVQWNPSKKIEASNSAIASNTFARDNNILSLTVGGDPRSLNRKGKRRRQRSRNTQWTLSLSYDIQLSGLPNRSTIGVLELSSKINFTTSTRKNCNEIARFELYDGDCPVKF